MGKYKEYTNHIYKIIMNIALAGVLIACGAGSDGISANKTGQLTYDKDFTTRTSTTDALKIIGLDENNPDINTLSGKGYYIGIVETGIFLKEHPELQGRIAPGIDIYGDEEFTGHSNAEAQGFLNMSKSYSIYENPDISHSMQTAVVAAGRNYGVAPQAGIFPYMTVNMDGMPFTYGDLYQTYTHAITNNVLALNASWTIEADYTEPFGINAYDIFFEDDTSDSFINVIKTSVNNPQNTFSILNPVDNYPVWVFATGNEYDIHPAQSARAPDFDEDLENLWLAVSAIRSDGVQLDFANACGSAKQYCLVAQGSNVITIGLPYENMNDIQAVKEIYAEGTSFAAPAVTGAFALLKERFPVYTVQEIRTRILETAQHTLPDGAPLRDKDGEVVMPDENGLSDAFGHGLLRLDIALMPVGDITTTNGDTLNTATRTSITQSILTSNKIFGDGIKKAFKTTKTTVFDQLDAPFVMTLERFAVSAFNPFENDGVLNPVFNNAFAKQNKAYTDITVLHKENAVTFIYNNNGNEYNDNNYNGNNYNSNSYNRNTDDYNANQRSINVQSANNGGIHNQNANINSPNIHNPNILSTNIAYTNSGATVAQNTSLFPVMQNFTHIPADMHKTIMPNRFTLQYIGQDYKLHTDISVDGKTVAQKIQTLLHYGNVKFNPAVSVVLENGAVLGAYGTGAMAGETKSATVFGEITAEFAINAVTYQANYKMGTTYADVNGDYIVNGFSPLHTQSAGLYAVGENWGIGITQPLYIQKGTMDVVITNGRDMAKNLSYSVKTLDITPSARENTAEAFYKYNNFIGQTTIRIAHTQNKNHINNMDDSMATLEYNLLF